MLVQLLRNLSCTEYRASKIGPTEVSRHNSRMASHRSLIRSLASLGLTFVPRSLRTDPLRPVILSHPQMGATEMMDTLVQATMKHTEGEFGGPETGYGAVWSRVFVEVELVGTGLSAQRFARIKTYLKNTL